MTKQEYLNKEGEKFINEFMLPKIRKKDLKDSDLIAIKLYQMLYFNGNVSIFELIAKLGKFLESEDFSKEENKQ